MNNSVTGSERSGKAVFISAGDTSGDLHASNLMLELSRREPGISFSGYGLDRMRGAGLEVIDTGIAPRGAMWLHNLAAANRFHGRLTTARNFFRDRPPELVILVDYGGFNLFLARAATDAGIPVLYYILPQVWAHGRYRLKKLRKWITKAAVIYPFEPEICFRYGVDAEYVGNPLFDELCSHPPRRQVVDSLRERHGRELIAIFPGSRRQEVRANLPIILEACRRLREDFSGLNFVAACPASVRDLAAGLIDSYGAELELSAARPVELARAARLCMTKSGTITLEIASQHTPMLVLYRLSAFLYFVAKGMSHTPYVGIVNALAGEMVCPEKVMWRSDPGWIVRRAREFLEDDARNRQCASALETLMKRVGSTGATQRTASIAMDMMA